MKRNSLRSLISAVLVFVMVFTCFTASSVLADDGTAVSANTGSAADESAVDNNSDIIGITPDAEWQEVQEEEPDADSGSVIEPVLNDPENADDNKYPVSLTYEGPGFYFKAGYEVNYYTDGHIFKLTYSDGSVKTIKSGENGYYDSNDNAPGYDDEGLQFDFAEKYEDDTAVVVEHVSSRYDPESGRDVSTVVSCTVPISLYPVPESLQYKGAELYYWPGTFQLDNFYNVGNKIIVTFSDGSTRTFICKKNNLNSIEYYPNGDISKEPVNFEYTCDYRFTADTKTVEVSGWFYFFDEQVSVSGNVAVKQYPEPQAVGFSPASGFTLLGFIGSNNIESKAFYGKGNKFVVKYSDGSKSSFVYKSSGTYGKGFYNSKNDYLSAEGYFNKALKRGANKVSLSAHIFTHSDSRHEVSFRTTVTAENSAPYTVNGVYTYTGKVITPKIKVLCDGETVPSSRYTYTAPKYKKMGHYTVKITFKKQYQRKYGESITYNYSILPKSPTAAKIKAGTKSLVISWKEFTSAQKKNIDGFYIMYGPYDNMKNATQTIKVSKNKSSATIRNLKSKEKYVVYVASFKKVNGVEYWSQLSSPKTVIVK